MWWRIFSKEESLFAIEDNVYHLCNHCGYIVKVNVTDKIKERVKKRCSGDHDFFKKRLLLSEFINIGGKE